MKHSTRLSYLMVLSWEIQRKKKSTRSKALQAAWAITLNEDITVYYLVKRHSNTAVGFGLSRALWRSGPQALEQP